MKNRIEKILREEKIASSKFADEIGVQRSSMSHILSGRNNPSLDIIQRILRKFPHINSDWLVLGVGDMYEKTVSKLNLFDDNDETIKEKSPDSSNEINIVKEEPQAEYFSQKTENKPITNRKSIKKIMVFYNDGSFEELIK